MSFELADEFKTLYPLAMVHPFPPYPGGLAQKYYEAGLDYFRRFDGFGRSQEILSTEEKFVLNIGTHTFSGISDLVLRDKTTGQITVIDHKSKSMSSMKKEIATYRKQLYIYAMHVKEKFGAYPDFLQFNMFRENQVIAEEFSERSMAKTKDWIIGTIKTIQADETWVEKESPYFCQFVCGVRNSCSVGKA